MAARRYKNGSFGVFTANSAIEAVPFGAKTQCLAATKPNTDKMQVSREDREMMKNSSCSFVTSGGIVAVGDGKVTKYQARVAPLTSKNTVTYWRDFHEKEIGDGPSNRLLAELFKDPGGRPPDIPLTMLGAGSKYRETFPVHSRREMRQALQEKPPLDFDGRNVTSYGWYNPGVSVAQEANEAVWAEPDMLARTQNTGGVKDSPKIVGLGDYPARTLLSSSQREFRPGRSAEDWNRLADGTDSPHARSAEAFRKSQRSGGARVEPRKAIEANSTVHLGMMGLGGVTGIEDLVFHKRKVKKGWV